MNIQSRLTAGHLRVLQTVSYVLVFLMMVCIVMTVVSLIQNTIPNWAPDAMGASRYWSFWID